MFDMCMGGFEWRGSQWVSELLFFQTRAATEHNRSQLVNQPPLPSKEQGQQRKETKKNCTWGFNLFPLHHQLDLFGTSSNLLKRRG
jgi:hypothetical protein